jgi:hypothetical protein
MLRQKEKKIDVKKNLTWRCTQPTQMRDKNWNKLQNTQHIKQHIGNRNTLLEVEHAINWLNEMTIKQIKKQ